MEISGERMVVLAFVAMVFMSFGFWLGYEKGIKSNQKVTIEHTLKDGNRVFRTYESSYKLIKSDTIKIY